MLNDGMLNAGLEFIKKGCKKTADRTVFFLAVLCSVNPVFAQKPADTAYVNSLNRQGFKLKQTDPDKTIQYASQAMKLSGQIKYAEGLAESYRVMGLGYSYQGKLGKSIDSYLNALAQFEKLSDKLGQAKVYNNIGSLYLDNNYDEAIRSFEKALHFAKALNEKKLIAGLHLNMGTVQLKQKNYRSALDSYFESYNLFKQLHEPVVAVKALGNIGVTNYEMKNYNSARRYLTEAVNQAKKLDLYSVVATCNQTLIYTAMAQNRSEEAQKYLEEGRNYAQLSKSEKLIYDYLHTSYEFEFKRKNYPAAISYLQQVMKTDSLNSKANVSDMMSLIQVQYRQREKERQNELIIERQKKERVFFWASTIVAGLLLGITFLLIHNVRRTSRNNEELTRLNVEINLQKDELDSINQHLEEMIDERTKEIKIKSQKLERFSLHLSHQIRGPVATLKGLMILEQENMIDKFECFEKMRKCIYDIDDQILNISTVLEDQEQMFNDASWSMPAESRISDPLS